MGLSLKPFAGLSPRVRGKRRNLDVDGAESQLYPRVCGGSASSLNGYHINIGLSPRVRGKPGAAPNLPIWTRSIPACAGETRSGARSVCCYTVYPRVCGGSKRRYIKYKRDGGLSPRVRGKPGVTIRSLAQVRSIPACAGEALQRRHSWQMRKVYPRVCGGSAGPG